MSVKLADTLAPMSDFPVAEAKDVDIDINGTHKDLQTAYEDGDLGGGSDIQVTEMPLPSVDNFKQILQYVGTNGTYINGYFYQCVSDGQDPATYSWEQKNIQPSNATASDVSYDNTTSELDATNVQGAIDEIKDSLGTASTKDFTSLVRPDSHDLVESGSVYSAINNALSAIYTPRGNLACADLTSALLIEANVGSVYQMSDSGLTSVLFINGAGITINTGDNVGIIKAGQDIILFNYMGNAFDLHAYQKKDLTTPITVDGTQQTTVEGALGALNRQTNFADNPIGTILPYGGATAPTGWMICDGTSLLRASYPELFAVIGTAFGSADSTHFNIPDMRESVPKGAGLTGKTVGAHLDADGLAVGEFLDDRVQNITGSFDTRATNYNNGTIVTDPQGAFYTAGGGYSTIDVVQQVNPATPTKGIGFNASRVARTGATTEVKSVGVNYIIKAKMIGVPADFLNAVDEVVEDAMGHSKVTIPFSSFVNPESHINSQYSTMTWHKFSNFGVLQFAILIDSGVAVDTRCMITENVKSLLGITNAWGREEVGIGGIASNDNTSIIGAQATVELRTGNDDLRFRINSSNGGWIRGQLFLSKS